MNLLAIDAATEKFSVALAGSGGTTWLFEADAGLRHSEMLMDCIDTLVRMAGLGPEDLSGVVCMGGPGSFTGLRIGFSVAKGLALSLGIPCAAVPTLDCMARPFHALPGVAVPVLDAKKKAFFCALYRGGEKLCPDMDAEPAQIARALANALEPPEQAMLLGPGAQMLYDALKAVGGDITGIKLGKGLRWGNAETLLQIATETQILTHSGIGYASGPEYIRKSDAEMQEKEQRAVSKEQ